MCVCVCVCVCVEVLQPSQPNGVMSSAVSLPNTLLLGKLRISKRVALYGDRWLKWMRVRLVIRKLRVRSPPSRQRSFVVFGHDFISTVIPLPYADSVRAVVSFWRKNVHNTDFPFRELM